MAAALTCVPPTTTRAQRAEPLSCMIERRRIPALMGCRAFAIAVVMADHYKIGPVPRFGIGPTGVTLFFVLTGFLITCRLQSEYTQNGKISLKEFYRRRVLRIFPAFYCFWIVHVLIYAAAGKGIRPAQVMSAFFFYTNYYAGLFNPPNMVMLFTWSLALQEQFYALWPGICARYCGRVEMMTRLLGVGIAAGLIIRLACEALNAKPAYLSYAFECRMDALWLGCLIAVLARQGRLDRGADRLCSRAWAPAATIALLAGLLAMEAMLPKAARYLFGVSIEALLTGALMLQLVVMHAHPWWKWIESRPLQYLGKISYSLYLYHVLVRAIIVRIAVGTLPAQQMIEVAAALLVAGVSYRLVEAPSRKWSAGAGWTTRRHAWQSVTD